MSLIYFVLTGHKYPDILNMNTNYLIFFIMITPKKFEKNSATVDPNFPVWDDDELQF
jgi:hypothetical protein